MFSIRLRGDADLRPLEPWQADEFADHLERARDHISPWVGASFVATDRSGAEAVLQSYADGQAHDERRLLGIWLNDALVGGVMFVSFNASAGIAEAGCWLEPAAEGRGLVSDAMRVLLDWAFDVRGLHRVEWRTLSTNARSVNVAKRLGMTLDGTMRNYLKSGAEQEVWSILSEEWSH